MQYDPQTYTTLCPILKETYARLVIPFESFIAQIKTKNPAGNLPDLTTFLSTAFAKQHSNPNTPDTPKDTSGADSLATPNSEHAPDRKTAQTINEEVKEASAKLNEVLQVGAQDAGIELAAGPEAALMGDEVPGDVRCALLVFDPAFGSSLFSSLTRTIFSSARCVRFAPSTTIPTRLFCVIRATEVIT